MIRFQPSNTVLRGLIFTRIQEGTQPGGLTQPGQTEQGIPYHVPSCWFPVGGWLGGGNSLTARERVAVVRSGRAGLWVVRFVLCFLLICIVVVPVPSVCCSVKLPLSRPACFFPFSSAPQQGEGQPRDTFVAGHSQTITNTNSFLRSFFS